MNRIEKKTGQAGTRRKCVLLILDGLGDLPAAELNGQTPLEAAVTPVLDLMASAGSYGLMDPIGPGIIPNTHSGTGLLMGLLAEQVGRLSRGPIEAAGKGIILSPGDIAVRTNFATMELQGSELVVLDRRAGRITEKTAELAAGLKDIDLGDGVRAALLPTDQHRCVLVLSGNDLSADITDTDPGSVQLPARMKKCEFLSPGSDLAASKINLFVHEAHRLLVDHPVNRERLSEGKLPANGIITRGAGSPMKLDNTLQIHGVRTAVIAACNTVLGLGSVFGFDSKTDPRFTATVDTDLDAKIAMAVSSLQSHDLVCVHFKAPDICSHDHRPLLKRDFLQRLDKAMEPLLATGAVVAVGADHTTDSNLGNHTDDPVPTLIYHPDDVNSGVSVNFGEALCRTGNMERQVSSDFLNCVLQIMAVPTV